MSIRSISESEHRSITCKSTVPRLYFSLSFPLYPHPLSLFFIFISISLSSSLYLCAFVVVKNCADHMTFSRSGKSKHQLLDLNFNFDFSLLLVFVFVFVSSSSLSSSSLRQILFAAAPFFLSSVSAGFTLAGYPSGLLRRWVGRT
ncbi:hypothetical protein H112_06319 [Trichophyton rubrum D6]|uniref:Transmembrane protein n=3 Tax=Trichophyton TaxID=5550 RepID=A0A080WEQ9_TRIRC|nr:uncharacterized protein TERG_11748 [Trichophyton rubrum CBS 118892]EZF13171.1 hypothetical protein H100_06333 [Trichophyton rubrum MR850]EZF39701.1 hypothetical protein H102_06300 [Trichophyton rubrum CBS 100081]EZF50225.1 hypothetical protein H103_06325 [Trichophyton rubrum CBS 288.86]EZF60857.1 hypothetical protein H104_06312 [Trichophyton rubrum CBS 289.86]EZF71375.1 hypothetical protein H105_06340 [Trichophyton soudanense CBS 452.61]EZF82184.1 hypothetical protein H110_06322 [Trichophy